MKSVAKKSRDNTNSNQGHEKVWRGVFTDTVHPWEKLVGTPNRHTNDHRNPWRN